jgi:hypothetical protein
MQRQKLKTTADVRKFLELQPEKDLVYQKSRPRDGHPISDNQQQILDIAAKYSIPFYLIAPVYGVSEKSLRKWERKLTVRIRNNFKNNKIIKQIAS